MKTMTDLRIAVLEDNTPDISDYLSELDRKTQNTMMLAAGEHFGFKTIEASGLRLTTRAEMSRIFGYQDESSLRKLLQRYDISGSSVGSFGHDARRSAQEMFNLSNNDGSSVFHGWDAFLLAGMKGQNEAALKVQSYLLKMERAGRLCAGTLDLAKQQNEKLKVADKVTTMLGRVDRYKSHKLKKTALAIIKSSVEDVLDVATFAQADLFEVEELPHLDGVGMTKKQEN